MLCYCLNAKRDFSSELLGPHRQRKPCSSARRSKMATSAHCATIEPAGLYPLMTVVVTSLSSLPIVANALSFSRALERSRTLARQEASAILPLGGGP